MLSVAERNKVYKQGSSYLVDQRTPVIFVQPKMSLYIKIKYKVEYLSALALTIILSPFLIIVSIAIKLDSKGKVIFKQRRYGLSGMPFFVYKFRTMVDCADKMQSEIQHLNEMYGGKLFKSDKDPRVTKLGRFLRKTSIDELPQLFFVFRRSIEANISRASSSSGL